MKACKKVKKLLVAYSCEELGKDENEFVRMHLNICPECKMEFDSLCVFLDGIENLEMQNEKIIQNIDWGKNDLQVKHQSTPRDSAGSRFRFFPSLGWQALIPVLVSVFIFGVLVGHFLINPGRIDLSPSFKIDNKNLSINQVNTTLAKKEILEYFKQIQLLLLDVVKQCENGTPPVLTGELEQSQVRQLLVKNRYLSQDLNEPQLMSTRNILKKIELLLYEILVMTDRGSCRDIRRLQNIIHQERIFLKIRLIEKDLSAYEV